MNSESKKIFSTQDAVQIAKQRLPRLIFDFIEGATGREVAARRNLTRFDEITLQPRVMQNVETRSLKTQFLGHNYDLPFGIAPMGMCNLAWPGADQAWQKLLKRSTCLCAYHQQPLVPSKTCARGLGRIAGFSFMLVVLWRNH